MKKTLFFLPLILLASDINPFGAGNINSNNPYGLTPTEKAIVENKKAISKLQYETDQMSSSLNTLKLRMNSYDEVINDKLASLNTILSELNQTQNNYLTLKNQISDMNETVTVLQNKISSIENEIATLKQTLGAVIDAQNKNMLYIKKAITDIYSQLKKIKKPLDVKVAFNKGRNLFFANKLNQAKEYFLYSLSKKYLPATSAYYLGEISYRQKNYNDALAYYKKSINLYPKKTSFTARLLYHTAISFEKLGNKKLSKLTLQKLISDFPNSKYANLAKKELEKLK